MELPNGLEVWWDGLSRSVVCVIRNGTKFNLLIYSNTYFSYTRAVQGLYRRSTYFLRDNKGIFCRFRKNRGRFWLMIATFFFNGFIRGCAARSMRISGTIWRRQKAMLNNQWRPLPTVGRRKKCAKMHRLSWNRPIHAKSTATTKRKPSAIAPRSKMQFSNVFESLFQYFLQY